tara:strand:+ start:76075 stop:77862 length:1788 start_codon:yes stop_codon:yes gene_type:complete
MTKRIILLLIIIISGSSLEAQNLPLVKARTYETNIFNDGGTKDIAWDRNSKRLFSINESLNRLEVYDMADITKPFRMKLVDLSSYISAPKSIAAFNGIIAVVGIGSSAQSSGKVLFFDNDGNFENQFSVGPLPDMVDFAPGGNILLIANEGSPTNDYSSDPAGSVSIINVSVGVNNLSQASVNTVSFTPLDSQAINPLVLHYGNNDQQLVSQDLEPEHITANSNATKAYVSLQENNAMMIIDIQSASIDTVIGLGYLDRGIAGNGLDASDLNTAIDIKTFNRLFGIFQPDAIVSFEFNGSTYIASANEGEPIVTSNFSDVSRLNSTPIDPGKFTNVGSLINDNNLGRLEVNSRLGDNNGDGLKDSLFTFGTRSFSIWDDKFQLIWDSGDEFEQIIAMAFPLQFNSDNDDNNSFKSRSDNRGPEPTALTIGEVDGTRYAFIGMERMGGFMVYDISDPTNPQFELYELNRDFSKQANSSGAGDLGLESIVFVPSFQSPTGIALLIVANEVSGTFSIYEIGQGIGLEEKDAQFLKAFPNPSTGNFNLEQYGNYKVFNSVGKLILDKVNVNSIDLSEEMQGLYIIKDEEGNVCRILKKN